jgi:hypothetical protein
VDNPKLKRLLVGEFSIRRVIRSGVLITLLVYVGVFVYVSVFGNAIIFQPPRPSYRDTEELIKLMSDGVQISALHLKNPNATYTILYSHGNAEDIGAIRPVLEDLRTMGFSVLAYDYRGYGTSAGASSEETTYRDIESAFDYLTRDQKIPPTQIIALGRSLGGAVAIDLACRRSLAGVIAESSFVSAYRVLTRFPIYPFDRFKSISKIREVHCPVLVIHGRNDEVISFWHGEKLFQAANEPKLFYWVDGAGHNDLFEVAGIGYGQALKSFVSLIERRDANR